MSKDAPSFAIRNWQQFQHYGDKRTPPWIKLHFELLTSRDWVMLADASRLLAVVSMLLASRNKGRVPADAAYVKKVGNLDMAPDFKPLVDIGFLVDDMGLLANASMMLAPASTNEEEDEYRKDEDKNPLINPPPNGEGQPQKVKTDEPKPKQPKRSTTEFPHEQLPDDWANWAYQNTQLSAEAINGEFNAIRDWALAKGERKVDWFAAWRGWLRRTANNRSGGPSRGNAKPTTADVMQLVLARRANARGGNGDGGF